MLVRASEYDLWDYCRSQTYLNVPALPVGKKLIKIFWNFQACNTPRPYPWVSTKKSAQSVQPFGRLYATYIQMSAEAKLSSALWKLFKYDRLRCLDKQREQITNAENNRIKETIRNIFLAIMSEAYWFQSTLFSYISVCI